MNMMAVAARFAACSEMFGNNPTYRAMRLRPEPADGLDGRFESDLPPFRKERNE